MSGRLNIEKTQRKLFLDTCKLLGLNLNDLSLAQKLRVDRASFLRLQIDDIQAAQLRGEPIDINKLVDASETLERLVGGDPNAPSQPDFSGAKEELARLLDQRANALERRRERAVPTPPPARLEKAASNNSNLPESNHSAAEPPPPPPPAPPVVDGAARANATRPPDHYLKGPDEPWRPFVTEAGVSTSPWRGRF